MATELKEKDIENFESKITKLAEKITGKCKQANYNLSKEDIKFFAELFDLELNHFSKNITEKEYLDEMNRRWWSFAD